MSSSQPQVYPLLGEILVDQHNIPRSTIDKALEQQHTTQQRLGEILVEYGAVDPNVIDNLTQSQRSLRRIPSILLRFGLTSRQIQQTQRRLNHQEPLEQIMRDTGFLAEEQVAQIQALIAGQQYQGIELIDQVDKLSLITNHVVIPDNSPFIPIRITSAKELVVATSSREGITASSNFFQGSFRVRWVMCSPSTLHTIITRYFLNVEQQLEQAIQDAETAIRHINPQEPKEQHAVRRALCYLLRYACYRNVSDIKLYTTRYIGAINVRIDGIGHEVLETSRELLDAFWTILAYEARLPAEALINKLAEGDLSFSSDSFVRDQFPDIFTRWSFRLELGGSARGGHSAVIRILDSEAKGTHIDHVGYTTDDLAIIKRALQAPDGLILGSLWIAGT